MIQACRTDLSIMRFNPKYGCKPDKELIKCAEALAREAKEWMSENEYMNKQKQSEMTNEQKRWETLPNINNETVLIWLDQLLEDKNKMFIKELTAEEIKTEIEETKGSMDNFKAWGDRHAIIDCEEYIEVLEEMLEETYEN